MGFSTEEMIEFENIETFEADLNQFARALDISTAKMVRRIALELFIRTVEKTPVDTGTARASWQLSINNLPAKKPELPKEMTKESATRWAKRQVSKLSRLTGGEVVYISNSVPYIIPLEYGSSKQSPEGMLRISLAEVEAQLRQLLIEAGMQP